MIEKEKLEIKDLNFDAIVSRKIDGNEIIRKYKRENILFLYIICAIQLFSAVAALLSIFVSS